MSRFLGTIALILGAFYLSLGSSCTRAPVFIDLIWTSPITGGPVEGYILQQRVGDGWFVTLDDAVFDTTYSGIGLSRGVHWFRVAAWNLGPGDVRRQGPWSPESDPIVSDTY